MVGRGIRSPCSRWLAELVGKVVSSPLLGVRDPSEGVKEGLLSELATETIQFRKVLLKTHLVTESCVNRQLHCTICARRRREQYAVVLNAPPEDLSSAQAHFLEKVVNHLLLLHEPIGCLAPIVRRSSSDTDIRNALFVALKSRQRATCGEVVRCRLLEVTYFAD